MSKPKARELWRVEVYEGAKISFEDESEAYKFAGFEAMNNPVTTVHYVEHSALTEALAQRDALIETKKLWDEFQFEPLVELIEGQKYFIKQIENQNAKLTGTLEAIMAWAAMNGHENIVKSIKETLNMEQK